MAGLLTVFSDLARILKFNTWKVTCETFARTPLHARAETEKTGVWFTANFSSIHEGSYYSELLAWNF